MVCRELWMRVAPIDLNLRGPPSIRFVFRVDYEGRRGYMLLGREEDRSLGNDGTRVIMAHDVFGLYHNIVSGFDGLVFRPPNGIFLDNLFDECLGLSS